ncbi:SEN54 [Candida pseudojiufengensis]|uniref:SEN54 n=1 Tax=Candida pseudojiufengensis TaxID=497109 RepID=UPI002224EEB2|nr:SEN54 [Candida pseudojiufengensis]KAI5967830.1 SEN54 [Candida pseudojiufengensis]
MSYIEDDEIPTADKLIQNSESKDEIELEDEIQQDWKQFTSSKQNISSVSIPKRGEKEFEPDGTAVQLTSLQESQNAMFAALSQDRGHHYSKRLIGVWCSKIHQCVIINVKGNYFKDMGKGKDNFIYLNSIETMYLAERGSLVVFLSNDKFEKLILDNDIKNLKEYNIENELWGLDLEYLYCLTEIDVAKYQIYAYLKRLGYLLMEVETNHIQKEIQIVNKPKQNSKLDVSYWLLPRKWGILPYPNLHTSHFASKNYFNYTNIAESISLNNQLITPQQPENEFNITFNVWRPTPQFSKKNPPYPDYQVCVVDSSKNQDYLSFEQIKNLQSKLLRQEDFETQKPKIKPKPTTSKTETKKQIKAKRAEERNKKLDKSIQLRNSYLRQRDMGFKYGYASLIIGIYNYGVLNFVNLSTGNFNCEFKKANLDNIYPNKNHSIIYNEF